MRCMRGARSRNARSMRVCHRSGGSKTCESDDRISAGTVDMSGSSTGTGSLEGGHHLASEELQASRLQLGWDEAARVQLGHDAVQPQLLAQLCEPVDHAGGRAEGDLPG